MSFKKWVAFATVVTFGLIMLGAYVRLSDAGLGCPDWPGCYGKLTPKGAMSEISQAVSLQGGEHGPVSEGKAWKEMVHRYIASALGLLIIAIAVMAWKQRDTLKQNPLLATVLVGVVCLQGAFGAWTVTLLLKPAIVTGHLIGGMLLLSLLSWLLMRQRTVAAGTQPAFKVSQGLRVLAPVGLIVVALQIVLGGWVSTNYAALACVDFPTCQGKMVPDMEFDHAFDIVRELGKTAEGDGLSIQALTAIHWVHRVGAAVVTLVLLMLAVGLLRQPATKPLGFKVLGVLSLQLVLGISNVVFHLPLPVAVLHNGGAALLLVTLILVNYRLISTPRSY
ncbi:MAG: COX15/CtaA family protein [Burkholderiales bacterium]|nr:COX15/CtaA family protein [Burkholderiales bacterium]